MIPLFVRLAFAVFFIGQLASAQTSKAPAPGSISGRVVSQDGRVLHGMVVLQPVSVPDTESRAIRYGTTGMDGTFNFPKLLAGRYALCAQTSGEQSADQPFLDGCAWGRFQGPIDVAEGRDVKGIEVAVPTGVKLTARVADPGKALPSVAVSAAAAPDTQLELIVRGANRQIHRPALVSQDAGGRSYEITVPANAPLTLAARSAQETILVPSPSRSR